MCLAQAGETGKNMRSVLPRGDNHGMVQTQHSSQHTEVLKEAPALQQDVLGTEVQRPGGSKERQLSWEVGGGKTG